ncbi:hypothetical protein [Jidongwangia harbinensis]|uniref:hypothetical protein n=1 Tax=Jidongwangia harbinensis TaxID=2878561 RepID=UPI001CD95AC3|nr:hypothetical protein [Jidongwangia harbinensis]MCA2219085.1 hypothetical protein [Jidongwangia harbinensis]
MVRRMLAVGVFAAAVLISGTTAARAADTQVFRGEGHSGFGPEIAYHYARADALAQARDAGFGNADCHEINVVDSWPLIVYVDLECTR